MPVEAVAVQSDPAPAAGGGAAPRHQRVVAPGRGALPGRRNEADEDLVGAERVGELSQQLPARAERPLGTAPGEPVGANGDGRREPLLGRREREAVGGRLDQRRVDHTFLDLVRAEQPQQSLGDQAIPPPLDGRDRPVEHGRQPLEGQERVAGDEVEELAVGSREPERHPPEPRGRAGAGGGAERWRLSSSASSKSISGDSQPGLTLRG